MSTAPGTPCARWGKIWRARCAATLCGSALLAGLLVVGAPPAQGRGPVDSRMAVVRAQGVNEALWVLGSGERAVRMTPAKGYDVGSPSWSPDRHAIVVSSRRFGPAPSTLVVIGARSHRRILTTLPLQPGFGDVDPDWGPDGRIVFASDRGRGPTELWTVSAVGGTPRRLTRHASPFRHPSDWLSSVGFRDPDWSPDGSLVAFAALRLSADTDVSRREYASAAIWVVPARGGRPRKLLRSAAAPAWSPDGRSLAFERRTSTGSDIFVADASGRHVRRVTDLAGDDRMPTWSPDGHSIGFVHFVRERESDVYVVRLRDGRITRVTSDPSIDLSPTWA